jgi:hypothetical protein
MMPFGDALAACQIMPPTNDLYAIVAVARFWSDIELHFFSTGRNLSCETFQVAMNFMEASYDGENLTIARYINFPRCPVKTT